MHVLFNSGLCNACSSWKEGSSTRNVSQEKSAYAKQFVTSFCTITQKPSSNCRESVCFSIFCRPKMLKVKMKGKCGQCVRWHEVDLIYCFENYLHPLLSALPLCSTAPVKKQQLVFLLDFINDRKKTDLANHVIFCMRINSHILVILSIPCFSRK